MMKKIMLDHIKEGLINEGIEWTNKWQRNELSLLDFIRPHEKQFKDGKELAMQDIYYKTKENFYDLKKCCKEAIPEYDGDSNFANNTLSANLIEIGNYISEL